MIKRLFVIFVITATSVLSATAQKELKQLRSHVKASRHTEALREIDRLSQDSTLTHLPQIYDYAVQVYAQIEMRENEKMYLQQQADTAAFFNAIHQVFVNAQLCQENEAWQKTHTHKYKPKFVRAHASTLNRLFPNLINGAHYYFARSKWEKASLLAQEVHDLSNDTSICHALGLKTIATPTQMAQMSYITVCSAYKLHDYQSVITHAPSALQDTTTRENIIEYLASAHAAQGDTTLYLRYLKNGLDEYPLNERFFHQLFRYYYRHQEYREVHALTDSLLQKYCTQYPLNTENTDSIILQRYTDCYEALMVTCYQLQHYDECIDVVKKATSLQKREEPIYHFLIGASFCQKAKLIELPLKRNSTKYRQLLTERKELYRQALEPMQTFREQRPQSTTTWAPFLYDIYLNLNMGTEFEEIQKVTESSKNQ